MTDTMKIAGPPNAEKRRTLYLQNKYLGPNAIKKRPVYPYLKDIIACYARRCKGSTGRYYSVASIGYACDTSSRPFPPSGCRGTGYFNCTQRYTWASREPIKYSILGVSNHLGLFHYAVGDIKRGPCYTTDKPKKKDLQKIIDNQITPSTRGPAYKSSTTKAELWKIIMNYDNYDGTKKPRVYIKDGKHKSVKNLTEYKLIESKLNCFYDYDKTLHYERVTNEHKEFLDKHKLIINKCGVITLK